MTALAALLASCSWIWPKEQSLEVAIQAADNINPNTQGQACPVVVRVYQLGMEQPFKTVDFFSLYGQESQILGKTLLSQVEMQVIPGESRQLVTVLAPETRFVAALAAFRELEQAQWRALVPAPKVRKRLDVKLGLDNVKLTLQVP